MKRVTSIFLFILVSAVALFAGDSFMEDWKFGAEYQPVQGTYGVSVEVAPVGNVAAYGSIGINDAYGKAGIIVHPNGSPVGFFLGGGARALKTYSVTTRTGTVDVDGTTMTPIESTNSTTTLIVRRFGFFYNNETTTTTSTGEGTFEGSGDFTYEDMIYTGLTFQGIGEAGLHINMGEYASAKLGAGWYGDSWGSNLTFAIGY